MEWIGLNNVPWDGSENGRNYSGEMCDYYVFIVGWIDVGSLADERERERERLIFYYVLLTYLTKDFLRFWFEGEEEEEFFFSLLCFALLYLH